MENLQKESDRNMLLSHFTIEHAKDAVIWLDSDGRIHRVNDSACRLLGYTPEELVGTKLYALHPEENEEVWRQRWKITKDKRVHTFEKVQPTKDGVWIPVEVVQHFLELEGEAYCCSFLHDLSERKRTEEDLRSTLAELERLKNQLQRENVYLQNEIKRIHNFENIICQSNILKEVLGRVEQVASTDATVLILGETGTGKELIARSIHSISPRSHRPLIKVDCAMLPANLIESELFGHEKGAFTGAFSRKIGRFEIAHGSTIFLDEIGNLPIDMQVKLLRVLQDGEFERLGSAKTITCDVRVITATNRNLEKEVEEGNFREDLYYRLNVFPIHIPSLRERKEDIPLLVKFFIQKYNKKLGRNIERIPQKVMERLTQYHWPGNVRGLENIIQRAMIVSKGRQLEIGDWFLPQNVSAAVSTVKTLEEVERAHITEVLETTHWRVSGERGAANILGMKPTTLESRMKKLGIKRKN
ncbi:MAG: sigma 54-interacting transcriptional regulator [Gemmatimonadota bacterium]|nr:MAG: sigma 54-interacting transcriptional regulator [Gemmatimonadota bacterium]